MERCGRAITPQYATGDASGYRRTWAGASPCYKRGLGSLPPSLPAGASRMRAESCVYHEHLVTEADLRVP